MKWKIIKIVWGIACLSEAEVRSIEDETRNIKDETQNIKIEKNKHIKNKNSNNDKTKNN